ncbi:MULTISPECIES: hypothetical protein [unclassified Okeania]|uniref:hypothetical protein n=1 Tax=unclassified Okeania TaxID=2634635 RepID=UPI0013B8DB92|nr:MULTISPECIES: hypothetical protein [unclassified Okeania]NES77301.1 hypothetical protein [Okeania sp. SIO1H4]NET15877.1 hypothetical protein [Okeania sp. SIO1H6]NET18135.1 hypothetical protein [Okeania sp. SIO1H5]NET93967.1 hypothetical protein [Okeania sp. SIO1H2]
MNELTSQFPTMWCVGTDSNVGKWNEQLKQWEDLGGGGWTLKMLAFDKDNTMWCVGTDSNIGRWNESLQQWEDLGGGGWTIKMLAFDKNNTMWCVGTDSNVGRWNESLQQWEDLGGGGWTIKMLAFDKNNTMWCVGTDSNVGKWNETLKQWEDQGYLGGWTLDWLAFDPSDPLNEVYCVGTGKNLGKYEFNSGQMLDVNQNWDLKMITFKLNIEASVTYKTITHLEILKIASSNQTVLEMIEKITTNGDLNEQYEYLYSDLFVVFNRIYNNGAGLDSSINNALRNEINHDFDRMHYHISVAEGLAAGIITSPGVSFEVDHAKDWSNKAQSNIQKLNDHASGIIINDETRRYVEGLQKATNDKALNVDQLIKSLFWTIIVNLNKLIVTKKDFEGKVAEIHLDLLKLKDAKWQGLFDLEGLKINLDKPGENDDLDKVQTTLANVGEFVGVLDLLVISHNWAVSGVRPGRFIKAAFQKLTSSTPVEAAEMTATGEAIEVETVEISASEAFADVLGVIGVLLLVIGSIIEAVQLDKELDKINSAKKDFNNNYNELVHNVESVVRASEAIRKHS